MSSAHEEDVLSPFGVLAPALVDEEPYVAPAPIDSATGGPVLEPVAPVCASSTTTAQPTSQPRVAWTGRAVFGLAICVVAIVTSVCWCCCKDSQKSEFGCAFNHAVTESSHMAFISQIKQSESATSEYSSQPYVESVYFILGFPVLPWA